MELIMGMGLRDWKLQRISAMLLTVFFLPLLVMWFGNVLENDYDWYLFLSSILGKCLTIMGLVGFAIHAKLGIWVVITDYAPRSLQKILSMVINLWISILSCYSLYLVWVL
jgi:succinate dehydrogenase / fumarate reductase membrane anchor subunit